MNPASSTQSKIREATAELTMTFSLSEYQYALMGRTISPVVSLSDARASPPALRSIAGKLRVGPGSDGRSGSLEHDVPARATSIASTPSAADGSFLFLNAKRLAPDARDFVVPVPSGRHVEPAQIIRGIAGPENHIVANEIAVNIEIDIGRSWICGGSNH